MDTWKIITLVCLVIIICAIIGYLIWYVITEASKTPTNLKQQEEETTSSSQRAITTEDERATISPLFATGATITAANDYIVPTPTSTLVTSPPPPQPPITNEKLGDELDRLVSPAPLPGDRFSRIATYDKRIVIGAPGYEQNKGYVFILDYTTTSQDWTTMKLLKCAVNDTLFGKDVHITRDYIFVRATSATYIYKNITFEHATTIQVSPNDRFKTDSSNNLFMWNASAINIMRFENGHWLSPQPVFTCTQTINNIFLSANMMVVCTQQYTYFLNSLDGNTLYPRINIPTISAICVDDNNDDGVWCFARDDRDELLLVKPQTAQIIDSYRLDDPPMNNPTGFGLRMCFVNSKLYVSAPYDSTLSAIETGSIFKFSIVDHQIMPEEVFWLEEQTPGAHYGEWLASIDNKYLVCSAEGYHNSTGCVRAIPVVI